jgi:hypothetical protein
VEVFPLPKLHCQVAAADVPVLVLVNFTLSGEQPVDLSAVKFACNCAETFIVKQQQRKDSIPDKMLVNTLQGGKLIIQGNKLR